MTSPSASERDPGAAAQAARFGVGFGTVARGVLRVTGADRVRFLQGLTTHDVAALQPGQGQPSAMLSVKGRVLAELGVLAAAEGDALLLALPADITAKVHALLDKHAIADDVEIGSFAEGWSTWVVVGAGAARLVEQIVGAPPPTGEWSARASASGVWAVATRTHGVGFELWAPPAAAEATRAALAAGGLELGEAALEVLRVEAGQPRYGVDVSEDDLPLESRLDGRLSFSKGCYVGQEVVVRVTSRGGVNHKLCGLKLAGDVVPPAGTRLAIEGRDDAGRITSAVRSRQGVIALGYVHKTAWDDGHQLTAHLPDGSTVVATVAPLPFIPVLSAPTASAAPR